MIARLIRLLSIATTGTAQNPVANKQGRSTGATSKRERPFAVDDSTAMAELMRLVDKQSRASGSTTKTEGQSDS